MNKKDFWTLMIMNITSLILLVECFCGLDIAVCYLCVWSIISLVTHICVLKDYVFIPVFVREDLTK